MPTMLKSKYEDTDAKHHILAAMNNWKGFEFMAQSNEEEFLVLEDDAIPVPGFLTKLSHLREQLETVSGGWDIVFLGGAAFS